MAGNRIVGASEFKAKCLEILDQVRRHEFDRVVITKRGVAVAVLVPPAIEAAAMDKLHGFMRGSVVIPPAIDLTAPVAGEAFAAARGKLHR
jgi:prevent-host-death family protein